MFCRFTRYPKRRRTLDANHFDIVTRSFSDPSSRRGIVRSLVGLALAGALTPVVDRAGAAARKRKKRKKRCRPTCGPCQTCVKGVCRAEPDGRGCAFGKTCQNGACVCKPGTRDVAGRCAAPCGDVCAAPCNCRVTITSGDNFCARDIGACANRIPCTSHDGCASNELCSLTGCPAVNGVTNKCAVLC